MKNKDKKQLKKTMEELEELMKEYPLPPGDPVFERLRKRMDEFLEKLGAGDYDEQKNYQEDKKEDPAHPVDES